MKKLYINYSIINNGLKKKFSSVFIYNSKKTLFFLNILCKEGVIRSYIKLPGNSKIEVFLKYHKGVPVMNKIIPISSGGRFIYYTIQDIYCWRNNYSPLNSFLIVSSSNKLFSSNELNKYRVGGEVLCVIS